MVAAAVAALPHANRIPQLVCLRRTSVLQFFSHGVHHVQIEDGQNGICRRWHDSVKWRMKSVAANQQRGFCRFNTFSNTTVYYGIHERSKCIPVDSGVTNLIHDRRSCVDFTLEVEANVARCAHSSVNKPGVKCNSGL